MKQSFRWDRALWAILLLGGVGGIAFAYHTYMYPFCDRGCTLRCMHGALLAFAARHYGFFPSSKTGAFDALQKLYPEYMPSGRELAGISGDVRGLTNALFNKSPINESLTSWVYIQGLRESDDPQVAVLWERRPGLDSSGRRNFSGARAVVLISGEITNVSLADWPSFTNRQEKLLHNTDMYRAARGTL